MEALLDPHRLGEVRYPGTYGVISSLRKGIYVDVYLERCLRTVGYDTNTVCGFYVLYSMEYLNRQLLSPLPFLFPQSLQRELQRESSTANLSCSNTISSGFFFSRCTHREIYDEHRTSATLPDVGSLCREKGEALAAASDKLGKKKVDASIFSSALLLF